MSLAPVSTPLTHFKLLSFDVYGTLIDWESGIDDAFQSTAPVQKLPTDHPLRCKQSLLKAYEAVEREHNKANPSADYEVILANVYLAIAATYGLGPPEDVTVAAKAVSTSVGNWPLFYDVLPALHTLKKYYRLVPLTNSSPATFGASLAGPFQNFPFDASYLASDIGSYKPDPRNFEFLLEKANQEFGVRKDEILHVAQSLYHDHVPATRLGLANCWVHRNGLMGNVLEEARVNWRVDTLGELASIVDEAWKDGGK